MIMNLAWGLSSRPETLEATPDDVFQGFKDIKKPGDIAIWT